MMGINACSPGTMPSLAAAGCFAVHGTAVDCFLLLSLQHCQAAMCSQHKGPSDLMSIFRLTQSCLSNMSLRCTVQQCREQQLADLIGILCAQSQARTWLMSVYRADPVKGSLRIAVKLLSRLRGTYNISMQSE